jgi:hypothetical protein
MFQISPVQTKEVEQKEGKLSKNNHLALPTAMSLSPHAPPERY